MRHLIPPLFPYTTPFRSQVLARGLAILEHDQCRHAADAQLARRDRRVVDVQLSDLDLTLHRFGDLFHDRSEEHTSELQSPCNLVCRLLLETTTPLLSTYI